MKRATQVITTPRNNAHVVKTNNVNPAGLAPGWVKKNERLSPLAHSFTDSFCVLFRVILFFFCKSFWACRCFHSLGSFSIHHCSCILLGAVFVLCRFLLNAFISTIWCGEWCCELKGWNSTNNTHQRLEKLSLAVDPRLPDKALSNVYPFRCCFIPRFSISQSHADHLFRFSHNPTRPRIDEYGIVPSPEHCT